jgi:hypothetical protein
MTLRRVVTVSCSIACRGLAISYVAERGSVIVVLGDDRLGGEVDDLLAQVDQRAHPLDEGRDDRQAGLERAAVATEALDYACAGLRDDSDRARRDDQREDDDHDYDDECCHLPLTA